MSSEIAIKVKNLSKCYQVYDKPRDRLLQMLARSRKQYFREFWALKDVSFEINKGEAIGIIGKNGSGKSTLLQLICGTLSPTSGDIQTNGRIAALLELGSGFNPEFTGRENVFMNAALLGLSREEIKARYDDIANFADIGDFIDQPVKNYSSGMYVRLAFAVAVNVSPEILIVDEALAVGDIRFQVKCHRKFEEFRNLGKTIIVVSHSSSEILRLCGRAIWLDNGKIRREGESKRVVEEYHAHMVHDTGLQIAANIQSDVDSSADQENYTLLPIPANACITGEGGVTLQGIGLFDENAKLLSVLDRTRKVKVMFSVLTNVEMEMPFFAFQVINRHGVRVLGSNTFVQGLAIDKVLAGQQITASFDFDFPELENGDYLIAIGVGDGNAAGHHIRHAFVADAYVFHVSSPSLLQSQAVLVKLPDCKAEVAID